MAGRGEKGLLIPSCPFYQVLQGWPIWKDVSGGQGRGTAPPTAQGWAGVRAGTLETGCGACGLRARPTGGAIQATACKGADLTHPLALAWAPGTGRSVSLTQLPRSPRPGQLNSGDFHGVGTVHSSVGSKCVTVEGQELQHTAAGPRPAQCRERIMPGTDPWMFLSVPSPCTAQPIWGLPTSSLGALSISFLGSGYLWSPDTSL